MGMFICFILPGILVGLLLGLGSKVVQQRIAKDNRNNRLCVQPAYTKPDHSRLFIYDMRNDRNDRNVA